MMAEVTSNANNTSSRENVIRFASNLLSAPHTETIQKIHDFILSNRSCNINQLDLQKILDTATILSPFQRKLLQLSSYLESIKNIPHSIAVLIAEFATESTKWNRIFHHFPKDPIHDLSIMVMIRIPLHAGFGRIGVILGTYPNAPNCNVEVHTNGRARFYWNQREIDLFGTRDLVDGVLEATSKSCGSDVTLQEKSFLLGRDYRNEALAFKGDILRISVWSRAFEESDIEDLTQRWQSDHHLIAKQRKFEFDLKRRDVVTLRDFTVIALIRIPPEIGNGGRRVGVILGNFNKPQNVNFEVHSGGKSRIWWNNGETNLYGKINVADGEWHCIVFMRDSRGINQRTAIYVDGEWDVDGAVGSDVTYQGGLDRNSMKIGRDYRRDFDQETSFKGDIMRLNAYSAVFTEEEIKQISKEWLADK